LNRIIIHSVPRSGSTWLGEIFNSNEKTLYKLQPLFSYAFKDRLNENSSKDEIDLFFKELVLKKDNFLDQTDKKEKGVIPTFNKNKPSNFIIYKEVRYHHILRNLLEKDNELKVIGLVRNPLSVINSWLRAPKEFRKELGWSELEEWRFAAKKNLNKPEEFNGFEKWKEVTLLFEELLIEFPDRFYLVKYNELVTNTVQEVKNLFDFCDLNLTEQTLIFINKSSNTDQSAEAYSVFRSKQVDDKWKFQLNPIIIFEIQKDLKETKLEKYLL
jgi:Sulfotransferase domain